MDDGKLAIYSSFYPLLVISGDARLAVNPDTIYFHILTLFTPCKDSGNNPF